MAHLAIGLGVDLAILIVEHGEGRLVSHHEQVSVLRVARLVQRHGSDAAINVKVDGQLQPFFRQRVYFNPRHLAQDQITRTRTGEIANGGGLNNKGYIQ